MKDKLSWLQIFLSFKAKIDGSINQTRKGEKQHFEHHIEVKHEKCNMEE